MGIFSFLKNIGKAQASEQPTTEDLQKEISDLGLEAEGVSMEVEGDKVVLSGKAPSQELLEKIILATGNTKGIAAVETNVDVEDGGAEAEFHTVEKGDTLSAIAKKVYGDAGRYPEIFEANKPMLSHPDKIYPGQVLRIPR